jgi:carboxylate-amine ligase
MDDHRFGAAAPFRLGVEEELLLVDPLTFGLERKTDLVLARARPVPGRLVGEICDGMLEVVTPVVSDAPAAVEAVATLRGSALDAGAMLIGAGLHPNHQFGDVVHRESEHYRHVGENTRGLLRQTPYCGTHVHVGMPDPESAIRAHNGIRAWLPLLRALGANSPFWYGRDSGLASARTTIASSLPRTGTPPAFADYADYLEAVSELCRVGELDGYGSIWWDSRPHPRLGTVELRVFDAQSALTDLGALTALAHCLLVHEALRGEPATMRHETLVEAGFRAARDGLDARVPFGDALLPVRTVAAHALRIARRYANELGAEEGLHTLQLMLVEGNGAARQRRAFEAGGMRALLEQLAAETAEGARRDPDQPLMIAPCAS